MAKTLVYPQNINSSNHKVILFEQLSYRSSYETDTTTGSRKVTEAPETAKRIYLEMPALMDITNAHTWDMAEINAPGVTGLVSGLGQSAIQAGKDALKSKAGFLGNSFERTTNTVSLARGASITTNPHKALLFEGSALREMNFQFDFFPESEAEAQQITEIIETFNESSRGSIINGIGLEFPNVWNIEVPFEVKENDPNLKPIMRIMDLGKIPFALERATPAVDTAVLYDGRFPSKIAFNILFKEIFPLYNQKSGRNV